MQHLRGRGWVKAFLLPSSEKLNQNLLGKGWIEQHRNESDVAYRITEKGLDAKQAPVRLL
ncbi:hypothetical protein LMTR13_23950 [Bradyrhizobium icense]|uniref:ArsR family transcriptional regulator n=1 Tax=Bradyrhizobium icense TaxID=1274631 RepID=A0A1B1UJ33_9BRAD|nr:hypothetical protein LMTR13_23950 [Bradyrhizobium icense]